MIRSQWISYLFSIAFAMSMAHAILPHSHTKEKVKHTKGTVASHHHHSDHSHSHPEKPTPSLPVFVHFSNGDFIGSVKYSFQEKQQRSVLILDQPIIISGALPILATLPLLVLHARDLPIKVFLPIHSLRAPPHFWS